MLSLFVKMKRLAILFLILLQCFYGFAQQKKYALLIGINQYQIKDSTGNIVLDQSNALNGCVNDAEAMKAMLINKFNFPIANITTLYNTNATRDNILKQIDLLHAKCKKGDVAVVYFAGHGMPYRYGQNTDDIAEVILPTNAFVTMPFAYIQQAELAKKFNLFVDKNVTLTAIFDCCFSLGTTRRGVLMIPEAISLDDTTNINFDDNWIEPIDESPNDADEYDLLANDSSFKNNNFIVDESMQVTRNRGLSEKKYLEMTKNVLPYGFTKADTTYNPPSQREGSQFVFISATNDRQIAPEMRDENGNSRGAFTYALTKVFDTNPAGISFMEVFQKTTKQLKDFGKGITPSARYKQNQRENKNLFGINENELKLKVYLPSESITFDDLNAMYKKWIIPLNKDDYKQQPLLQNNPLCSKIYIINKGKKVLFIDGKTKKAQTISTVDALKEKVKGQSFFMYLPVPSNVSNEIRKECLKNNKIELVNDMRKADVALYCTNYAPNSNALNNILDFGRNLTNNLIDYDYKDKLAFVGSNETIGVKRNKPGHFYSAKEDIVISATETLENISKKTIDWLNMRAGK